MMSERDLIKLIEHTLNEKINKNDEILNDLYRRKKWLWKERKK